MATEHADREAEATTTRDVAVLSLRSAEEGPLLSDVIR
jgi:hypothetical protein